MPASETCPKCSARFSARKALVSHGLRVGYNGLSGKGPEVRCPNCWHVSESHDLRLFGFIPAHALRWVVLGILVICVLLLFWQRHGSP
ncbi:MAG: hypothetical protein ABW067_06005 [Rhizobacter sp.]